MNNAYNPLPRRDGEIAINARILYLYIGHPELSYETWAASLHRLVASRGHVSRFRIMTGDDGELALNVDFATHFAQEVASDLMGAIALILIEEGCDAAIRGDFDYTNRMLDACKVLALGRGQMSAVHLHAFLQVEKPFGRWITSLKKRYGMKYGSDYIRVTRNGLAGPKLHPKDTGKGDVFLGPKFAMKVASEEPTRRGRLVQRFSENFRALGD